ncbi:MAG: BlaI/MecI/CopY family transcriptional regulator [Bacteroidales bacterium]|jgi:predicted transcriptional regulator|nr:BlaI/MecI/CopY family transcriptional regulator [Bacteroidales bacterium]
MKKLTRKEEDIMQVIWDLENALVSDIISKLPEKDLPYTTISSIVRILEKKGFVDHRTFGKTHQYYPLISKEEYRKSQMKSIVKTYFDSSYKNVVSFFAENDEISPEDLKEILDLIENKKLQADD